MHGLFARAERGRPDPSATPRRRLGIACAAIAGTAALIIPSGAGQAVAEPKGAVGAVGAVTAAETPAGVSGDPSWMGSATKTGPLASGSAINLTVLLNGKQDAAAEQAAIAVSSPSSAHHGKYLSAAAYRDAYAPTDAQVASVTGWLTRAGFAVTALPDNHLWVRVRGTAEAATKAFGVGLDSYTMNGLTLHAPAGTATIPAAVQPLIAGIEGLSSSIRRNQPQQAGDQGDDPGDRGDLAKNQVRPSPGTARGAGSPAAPPPAVFLNAPTCSTYFGEKLAAGAPTAFGAVQPYVPCGYVPSQVRGAYGLDKIGVNGAGVRVAVVDAYASPTIENDANTYAAKHGGAAFSNAQFTQIIPSTFKYGYNDTVNGDLCGEQGWFGEETLDIEAVHGVAPQAKIVYAGAASCDDPDLLDSLNTIVDGHKADIITNSWGGVGELDPVDNAALLQGYKRVFIQAALQGIGVFFSSGDNGDESDTGTASPDFPASSPWLTAVGGTSLGIGSKSNYLFEAGWGTGKSTLTGGAWTPAPPGSYLYGGGGGISLTFDQPWYQQGVVPDSILSGQVRRVVPDLATVGDPSTGFLVGQTQTFANGTARYSEYRIGGTSLSSPVAAGIEALSDQAAGEPHGFANPAIYQLAGTRAVHDILMLAKPGGVVRVDYSDPTDSASSTTVSLRSFEQFRSLEVGKGYDDVTGIGTPNGYLWVYGLGQTRSRAESYAIAQAG
jgi:subtilase family serine protease